MKTILKICTAAAFVLAGVILAMITLQHIPVFDGAFLTVICFVIAFLALNEIHTMGDY